ncbi:WD40-repeat-containing domain protein, partial [Jimgerdemannia flammicorona]
VELKGSRETRKFFFGTILLWASGGLDRGSTSQAHPHHNDQMNDDDRSCVYGLRHQHARCLTAVPAASENNKFLVGTLGPKRDNAVCLLDFDEDAFEIGSTDFRHPDEVWDITSCPKKEELFFTCHSAGLMTHVSSIRLVTNGTNKLKATLWRMGSSAEEKDNRVTNSGVRNDGREGAGLQLQKAFTLAADKVKKVLWEPRGSMSQVVSMDDTSLRIWSLNDSLNGAQLSTSIAVPITGDDPTTYLTNAVWNPHAAEIVTVNEGCLSGWDLRSQKQTFSIPSAHASTIRALDYNPNKPHSIVTGGDDGRIRFWDMRNGGKQAVKVLSDHTHWIWSVAFNRFHDQLVLSSSSDNLVNLQSVVSISSAAFDAYEDNGDEEGEDQQSGYYNNNARGYGVELTSSISSLLRHLNCSHHAIGGAMLRYLLMAWFTRMTSTKTASMRWRGVTPIFGRSRRFRMMVASL